MTAYVSFSKVTAADFGASTASDDGVTERDVIFPLLYVSERGITLTREQKLLTRS